MNPLTRRWLLNLAGAGAVALTVASNPARSDELAQNLGPVGPNEPILTTVGDKRVIAFYLAEGGHCTLNAVVWNTTDANADSAARLRIRLNPRQLVHIDSAENKSLTLQCGDKAGFIAAGVAE